VQDVRLQDCYAQVTPGLAECCESACWRVLCKCMLDIRCSVLRGWSCAITKSFEFWLRTVEKMGLILKYAQSRARMGIQSDFRQWHGINELEDDENARRDLTTPCTGTSAIYLTSWLVLTTLLCWLLWGWTRFLTELCLLPSTIDMEIHAHNMHRPPLKRGTGRRKCCR